MTVAERLAAAGAPGSDEAVKNGCTCPVIDNHYGRGVPSKSGSPWFWTSSDCPLHAPARIFAAMEVSE